jgi:hypothetical protein
MQEALLARTRLMLLLLQSAQNFRQATWGSENTIANGKRRLHQF